MMMKIYKFLVSNVKKYKHFIVSVYCVVSISDTFEFWIGLQEM